MPGLSFVNPMFPMSSERNAKTQLTQSVLLSLQAGLQAAFITKALHRKPREIRIANTAMVLFCNLGMWLVNAIRLETMIGRSHDLAFAYNESDDKPSTAFRQRPFVLLHVICLPLVVFFHIHCVFVLYRVLNRHRRLPS